MSKSDNVLSGVPQGTVLGAVLFLVLISDISNNVDSNITSFADDTKVFATINNPSDCNDLQSDLDNIYSWTSDNNMMFNQEKFQYIICGIQVKLITSIYPPITTYYPNLVK